MLKTAQDYHYQPVAGIDVERVPVWISGAKGMPMRASDVVYLAESCYVALNSYVEASSNILFDVTKTQLSTVRSGLYRLCDAFYNYYGIAKNNIKRDAELPEGVDASYYVDSPEVQEINVLNAFPEQPDFEKKPWHNFNNFGTNVSFIQDVWKYLLRLKRVIDFQIKGMVVEKTVHEISKNSDDEITYDKTTTYRETTLWGYWQKMSYRHRDVRPRGTSYVVFENFSLSFQKQPGIKNIKINNIILKITEGDVSKGYNHVIKVDAETYQHAFTIDELKALASVAGVDPNNVYVTIHYVDVEFTFDFEPD